MAQLSSQRDEPNTSREYETTYILRPDTSNDGVKDVNLRVRGVIDQMGGKVLKIDNWGKRKLAYEIKKELKGIYLYWHYLATPGVVEEVERNLRMVDSCVRYYTIKVDENVVPDARPSELSDETFAKASETAADEEEIVTGYGTGAQARSWDEEGDGDDLGFDADVDDFDDVKRVRRRVRDADDAVVGAVDAEVGAVDAVVGAVDADVDAVGADDPEGE